MKPIYLDCNATTPVEDEVKETVLFYLEKEYGNSGSRTHSYGQQANKAVNDARAQVADLVDCDPDEVVFTSGATESNNLLLSGIVDFANKVNKKHIISCQIEHKAILEPLEHLSNNGFDVELLSVDKSGAIKIEDLNNAIREDTLLITIMHANNETGIVQPVKDIAALAKDNNILFHTDAAQTFGKIINDLENTAIDVISFSGHKIYGPKGIGGLIVRRNKEISIEPIQRGGGQERGLRPGTLPVHLIAGIGKAAEIAKRDYQKRLKLNQKYKKTLITSLCELNPTIYGEQSKCLDTTISMSFGDIDSEALMIILRDYIAISNGSACTSSSYEASHVLLSMGLSEDEAENVTRWSWCHLTETPDWTNIKKLIAQLI